MHSRLLALALLFAFAMSVASASTYTFRPTLPTSSPTLRPTRSPTVPTAEPTPWPTYPTKEPTLPTLSPTRSPTKKPTPWPTRSPTVPTAEPTSRPSLTPTITTVYPSQTPTLIPTFWPTSSPTRPTTRAPTNTPTFRPTSISPTRPPTGRPTTTWAPTQPLIVDAVQSLPVSSDVTAASKMDLDVRDMDRFLSASLMDFTNAHKTFTEGRNSPLGAGRRSLDSLGRQMDDTISPFHVLRANYFGSAEFGADYLLAALSGTGAFEARNAFIRAEAAKGALFWVVWPSVVDRVYRAIAACEGGMMNQESITFMLDEAWALFSGSLVTMTSTSTSFSSSNSLLELAGKMCNEFGKCVGGMNSAFALENINVAAYIREIGLLIPRETGGLACTNTRNALDGMVTEVNIVLARRLLSVIHELGLGNASLAVYNVSEAENAMQAFPESNLRTKMMKAMAWNSAGPLLPYIARCDPNAANALRKSLDVTNPFGVSELANPNELIALVQSTFPCLGFTCEQVGESRNGLGACNNKTEEPAAPEPVVYNIGTMPLQNDVREQAKMDGDVADMIFAFSDLESAKRAFTEGGSSAKLPDTTRRHALAEARTLYSLADPTIYHGEPIWELFREYYESETFGRDYVLNALNQESFFQGLSREFCHTAAIEGTQHLVVFHHVVHLIEQALANCNEPIGAASLNLDEAWAYYTGSTSHYLLFAGSVEHCRYFDSCVGNGTRSRVNDALIGLFSQAQLAARQQNCDNMRNLVPQIQAQMYVQLIQGLLIHLGEAKAWTYAYALLPVINQASPSAAQLLRSIMFDPNLVSRPMGINDSLQKEVRTAVASTFTQLGLTCEQILGNGKANQHLLDLQSQACVDAAAAAATDEAVVDDYQEESIADPEDIASRNTALAIALPLIYLASLLVTYAFTRRHYYIVTDVARLAALRREHVRASSQQSLMVGGMFCEPN